MATLEDVYIQTETIVTREVMDNVLLVPIQGNTANMNSIFTLNPTGYFAWSLMDGSRSLGAITERMAARHGAPLSTIQADLCELASELLAAGLIRSSAADGAADA